MDGRGTFENSQCVKEFVGRMIDKGRQEFVLDLGSCELMDSTFMGMLTSVAFQLREVQSGQLRVVRANERNFSLLESLGLDHLFQVEPEPAPNAPSALKVASAPSATLSMSNTKYAVSVLAMPILTAAPADA